jgi:hypothetical protein
MKEVVLFRCLDFESRTDRRKTKRVNAGLTCKKQEEKSCTLIETSPLQIKSALIENP